jgi:osmotically-inducible protein OsmY
MLKRFVMLLSATAMVTTIACGQSDPGITTAVKSKLAADDTVKAYQIDVDTRERVVTLSGTVDTPAAKDQAVTLARQTSGVRDVVDNITVNRETAPTAGDLGDAADQTRREAGEQIRESTEAAKDAAHEAGAAVSDAAITSAVKTKFLADPSVAGLKIDVDTNAGIVTLSGMVATRAESEKAMSLASQTSGVKNVVNHLRVGKS